MQNPVYGDPKLGGKPPYYENWNFGIQRSLIAEHDAGRGLYAPAWASFWPGPATAAARRSTSTPLKYLALGPLLTATATPPHIASAQGHCSRRSRCRSRTYVGTIGQMLRPFPQYGASLRRGSMSASPIIRACRRRSTAGSPRASLSRAATRSARKWTICWPSRAIPSTIRWKNRAACIDHRHVFTFTSTYQLPFGDGTRDQSGQRGGARAGQPLVGFGTGAPSQTGAPLCAGRARLAMRAAFWGPAFRATTRRSRETCGSTANYGDGNVIGGTPTSYLDRNAFVAPAAYTVGQPAAHRRLRAECAVQLAPST